MENKMNEQELKEIKDLKMAYKQIGDSLGQVEINIALLNIQKEKMLDSLKELQIGEAKFAEMLKYKYGEGNFNFETGEFFPKEVTPVVEPIQHPIDLKQNTLVN